MISRIVAIIFFASISTVLYAQSRLTVYNNIYRIDAFFEERFPGNIPVDDNGNPLVQGPDTIFTIYVEMRRNLVKWQAAWKNKNSYSVIGTPVTDTTVDVGVSESTGKRIVLKPNRKHTLWLLQLVKDAAPKKPPIKSKPYEIVLKGQSGKLKIISTIKSQVQLVSLPSP